MATPTNLPATFVDGNILTAANLNGLRGAFRILQVAQAVRDTSFSASVAIGGSADITGLSVTITPSSTTNQILIHADVIGAMSGGGYGTGASVAFKIIRGTTDVGIGAANGNRTRLTAISTNNSQATSSSLQAGALFLDSPATTSATTYKIALVNAVGSNQGTSTMFVNRNFDDSNSNWNYSSISTITVMEVSA